MALAEGTNWDDDVWTWNFPLPARQLLDLQESQGHLRLLLVTIPTPNIALWCCYPPYHLPAPITWWSEISAHTPEVVLVANSYSSQLVSCNVIFEMFFLKYYCK